MACYAMRVFLQRSANGIASVRALFKAASVHLSIVGVSIPKKRNTLEASFFATDSRLSAKSWTTLSQAIPRVYMKALEPEQKALWTR